MDEATRGFLEATIDDVLKGVILECVEWVEEEIPISSLRDVALGYILGILDGTCIGMISVKTRGQISKEDQKKDHVIVEAMLKRRIPEILRKINRELGV